MSEILPLSTRLAIARTLLVKLPYDPQGNHFPESADETNYARFCLAACLGMRISGPESLDNEHLFHPDFFERKLREEASRGSAQKEIGKAPYHGDEVFWLLDKSGLGNSIVPDYLEAYRLCEQSPSMSNFKKFIGADPAWVTPMIQAALDQLFAADEELQLASGGAKPENIRSAAAAEWLAVQEGTGWVEQVRSGVVQVSRRLTKAYSDAELVLDEALILEQIRLAGFTVSSGEQAVLKDLLQRVSRIDGWNAPSAQEVAGLEEMVGEFSSTEIDSSEAADPFQDLMMKYIQSRPQLTEILEHQQQLFASTAPPRNIFSEEFYQSVPAEFRNAVQISVSRQCLSGWKERQETSHAEIMSQASRRPT